METSTTHKERLKPTFPEQNMYLTKDDDDTEGEMLTNVRTLKVDYEELQKFLETEGKPKIFRKLSNVSSINLQSFRVHPLIFEVKDFHNLKRRNTVTLEIADISLFVCTTSVRK